PAYKQAWYNKGYTFHGINRLEEAVAAYEKALALDEGDEVLWNNLGNALYNLGRYDASIPYFEKALEVNPKYEIAWNNIGNALNKMGRHAESLTYHDKSLEIKPDFDYALYAKGHALDSLGRHEEGLELISQSLELNPNYDHAWMAKAEALHHLSRLEEARDALNNALILSGEYDEAWVFRGKILEEMGNALEAERCYEEGLHCFRESLELEPQNGELWYHQGRLLEDLERIDEAIEAYSAAATRGAGVDALARLAGLLLSARRAADALVPADEARSKHPEDPRGWLAAGRATRALGRPSDAVDLFRHAIELGGGPEASIEQARTLQSLGRLEEALAALSAVEGSDAEPLLLRADLHAALGRAEDALGDCDAAIRLATEGRDLAYRRKGRLLLDLGRSKEAAAAYDAALGLNPSDADAWCDAALAWRAQGQEARASKMLDHALRLDPSNGRATRLQSDAAPTG
ncbi:MAG: tetratricopeptide repeat protein, partial [Methanobacteriota archaeon]